MSAVDQVTINTGLFHKVYYLTGMRGKLHVGLGEAIQSRGFEVLGRELAGDFGRAGFRNQVELIIHDLRSHWFESIPIIANSFGAYLLLHALTELAPYPGKILILSPILGTIENEEKQMFLRPPQSTRIFEIAEKGMFPTPKELSIHVGENDWQSDPKKCLSLSELIGGQVMVVPEAGHSLPQAYVSGLLDAWL